MSFWGWEANTSKKYGAFFPHLIFNYIIFGAYELFSLIRSVVILHELILSFIAESKLNCVF